MKFSLSNKRLRLAPWVVGFGLLALFIVSLPVWPLLVLRWVEPPTSAFMHHNVEKMRADGYPNASNRWQWVDYDQIAPAMRLAAVASEDQNFPTHAGFDTVAIRAAWEDMQAGEDFRGASTITQQTVKNLFLWRGQTWLRKGVEAWIAGWMDLVWSKRRILEVYLNIVQFDANVFGVEAAAQKFYAVTAAQLSREQAAMLVVALPAPSAYKVESPGEYMQQRQQWVLRQMDLLGPNYLNAVNNEDDAMSGIAWLITMLVIAFVIGIFYHSWKALKYSDGMLKRIDKSKLKDLSEDEWENDDYGEQKKPD